MNYRPNNHHSFYQNPRLGQSNVSKAYGYSNRNAIANDDHNIAQLQYMLQNQRKKFREAKDKYEHELDNQRKLRIQFQNKLIKLKDQFSRRDVSTSELQFKINNLLHQNQDLSVENERLKHELARLEDIYTSKIRQLETQLDLQTKNFEQTTIQYNNQFQKFKKQGQDYVQQLTFQFQRKIKTLQQKNKSLELSRKDLSLENKKLNDIVISNKLSFEQEIRDLKNRARDEQIKKIQQLTRTFDQKIKMIEDSKQILLRKNQQLLRALQQKERQLSQLEAEQAEQVNKLRQDCADLGQQNNHLNYLLSKIKQQLAEKALIIGRSISDNDSQLIAVKQQLQQKKQQNFQLISTVRETKASWKEAEADWERRKRQMLDRQSALQSEARKYKDEYLRICEVLKSKINNAIDGVSYKK